MYQVGAIDKWVMFYHFWQKLLFLESIGQIFLMLLKFHFARIQIIMNYEYLYHLNENLLWMHCNYLEHLLWYLGINKTSVLMVELVIWIHMK